MGIFEILERDVAGRIGKLRTPHGTLRTPCLLPVVNPVKLEVPIEQMKRAGVEALMTNAYLIYRHNPDSSDVHKLLGFEGPIATDSGGFQILKYGSVEVGPEEIVRFQEKISPDIAVILDVPTSARDSRKQAEEKVNLTIQRAREAVTLRRSSSILWCAPVQGGKYLELVERCAREVGEQDYSLHAIGGPVEYFERYQFDRVVDLTMTAKRNLPLSRPVHLFGAGHPLSFSLAVLMGCDLFDSAAYALFAKADRYMTAGGTLRLEELEELPCECPVCLSHSVSELKRLEKKERVKLLALHNLHLSLAEVRRIKQAIAEGRLWDYTYRRCLSHPGLLDGFRRLALYSEWLVKFDPVTKPSGFLYAGPESAWRPEVLRHRSRMKRYTPPPVQTLLIVPFDCKPPAVPGHVLKLVPPFGIIPEELSGFYPLGQYQLPRDFSREELLAVLPSLREYLERFGEKYEKVILVWSEKFGEELLEACGSVTGKLEVYRKAQKS
ncbi:MAG: tRNA guanosine(15) transglycosylase TgtA [Candidatus Hadarchaeales archaeon]